MDSQSVQNRVVSAHRTERMKKTATPASNETPNPNQNSAPYPAVEIIAAEIAGESICGPAFAMESTARSRPSFSREGRTSVISARSTDRYMPKKNPIRI